MIEGDFSERYDLTSGQINRLKSYQGLKLKVKPKDLSELIYRLIWRTESTYFKDGRKQVSGVRRSLGDIFRIVYYYKPKVDYKQVADIFYRITREYAHIFGNASNTPIVSDFCNQINKWVHFSSNISIREESLRRIIGKDNIKF